jgi:CheY-like chemotaxis protein
MSVRDKRSAILRAEILRGGSAEITCALEMTRESVFIVTDSLPSVGDVVSLRLSFPRTVRPVMASARVRQVRMTAGPGTPTGFVADFEIESDDVKRRITELALRVRPESAASSANRNLQVLLIEDNQLIRDMFAYAVERYFRQRTFKVELAQADTVAAARKHLEARSFDLVVVDHVLPDENGAAFIAALRRDPDFRRMPIVGMSVGGTTVQVAMLEAGADLFLHKPIVLKDLFCTLEFLMSEPSSERGAA